MVSMEVASAPHRIPLESLSASLVFSAVASAKTPRERSWPVPTSLRSAHVGQHGDDGQVFSAGSPHRCGQGREPTMVAAQLTDNERQRSAMTSRRCDIVGISPAAREARYSAGPAWFDVAVLETNATPYATDETSWLLAYNAPVPPRDRRTTNEPPSGATTLLSTLGHSVESSSSPRGTRRSPRPPSAPLTFSSRHAASVATNGATCPWDR